MRKSGRRNQREVENSSQHLDQKPKKTLHAKGKVGNLKHNKTLVMPNKISSFCSTKCIRRVAHGILQI